MKLFIVRGGKLLYVKVRHGDRPVLRWYQARGYQLVPPAEPVILPVEDRMIAFADGDDGYHLLTRLLTGPSTPSR
ncbi:hypothetical protein [Nonomuraea sp. NPDC049784]|uniref:hypothetical protein n=1 Tax=Nonomuraea sp. NPDC049784 TaxID=3154361 RepID=UPI0034096784